MASYLFSKSPSVREQRFNNTPLMTSMTTSQSPKYEHHTDSYMLERKNNAENGGKRDTLLIKCKSAIEELHLEIEQLHEEKRRMEIRTVELEKENLEKQARLSEKIEAEEKKLEEINDMRQNNTVLHEKIASLEEKLRCCIDSERRFQEISYKFQDSCQLNTELEERNEELSVEVQKRDRLVTEWQETLHAVNKRIMNISEENEDLKYENERLAKKLENAQAGEDVLKNQQKNLIEDLKREMENKNTMFQELQQEREYLRAQNDNLSLTIENLGKEQVHVINQKEIFYQAKLEEVENLLTSRHEREMLRLKEELYAAMEKSQQEKQKAERENEKLKEERQELKIELKTIKEFLSKKEKEMASIMESSRSKIEKAQDIGYEEIQKLQLVIEDQTELIRSYEQELAEERNRTKRRVDDSVKEGAESKRIISDLARENRALKEKLESYQGELNKIQSEFSSTFQDEGQKLVICEQQISDLKLRLREKDDTIDRLKSEAVKIKLNYKRKKSDITGIADEFKTLKEELELNQRKMIALADENDQLKHLQDDFQGVLKRKINEISNEVQTERDKRIREQNTKRELEEKLLLVESRYMKEFNTLKLALNQKEKECERLQQRQEGSLRARPKNLTNEKLSNTQQFFSSTTREHLENLETEFQPKIDSASHRRLRLNNNFTPEPHKPLTRRRDDIVKSKEKAGVNDPQPKIFVNKFKKVITNLEKKLEKMSNDLQLNEDSIEGSNY